MTALDLPHSPSLSSFNKADNTPPLRRIPSSIGKLFLRRSILALGVIAANANSNQIPEGVISFDQNANTVHKRLTPDGKTSKPAPTNSMIMMSANQAALIAKQQHSGGKVLKVSPFGQAQKVKLLLPGGKVTYVTVDSNGQVK